MRALPRPEDPRLLVGLGTADDCAVYEVEPGIALVHSVDFFMPIVDDPRAFGRIAAANSLSDIYAMGAEPLMALAVLGIPRARLGPEVAAEIVAGGAEKCAEAGIALAGGHSIDDAEPKFGLAVIGRARLDEIWRNDTGRAGDVLVLTKPVGVGVLAHAIKHGRAEAAAEARAVALMERLNAAAARAGRRVGVRAATDVTGFGLVGHAWEMARGAGLGLELWPDAVPVLEGARELVAEGVHPGATRRNLAHVGPVTRWRGLDIVERRILADPQTSGGLLLAVEPDRLDALLAALAEEGTAAAAPVGRLVAGGGIEVRPPP